MVRIRAAESESESESELELESVGVDCSARSRSRSRSRQNLIDSDSGVGINAAGSAMYRTYLIDDTALDIIFCREEKNIFCFGRTFSAKEGRDGGFPRTCFFEFHMIFVNAYLQRKALERTRDRFRQDKKHLHYELQYQDIDFNRSVRGRSRSWSRSRS